MSASTDVEIRVQITAAAQCPKCGKRLEQRSLLAEEQLTTGNTTQMASYHARALRASIDAAKKLRGWTDEMCGACRDAD